jgi:hypothetical protein
MNRNIAVVAALAVMLLQSTVRADEPAKGQAKGYTLHEWGVFSAYQNVDLANADMRAEWDSMPTFIYGQVPGRNVPTAAVPVRKPVIYFHAVEALNVKLRVDFPEGGMPAVWWPATSEPAVIPRNIAVVQPPARQRHLVWQLRLKEPFTDRKIAGALQPVDDGSWIKSLRDVEADDVHAWVGGAGYAYEREKFVYYDGLMPRGKWAEVTATKDKVRVRNQGDQPLFDVTAIDLRPNGTIRVARLEKLDSGATVDALEFKETDKAAWPSAGMDSLVKQLTTAGLNKDEAVALGKVWQRDFFQTEGLTVFYRLPQAEYERLLPLKAEPAPRETVRVGLILHPHCEPGLAEQVAALVKEMESSEFDKREQAQKKLEELGRPAMGHLLRLRNSPVSLDLKQRLNAIVEKYESARSIPVEEKK